MTPEPKRTGMVQVTAYPLAEMAAATADAHAAVGRAIARAADVAAQDHAAARVASAARRPVPPGETAPGA